MRSRIDISLAVAACGSLAIHALAIWGMSRMELAPLSPASAVSAPGEATDGSSSAWPAAAALDTDAIIQPPTAIAQAEPEPELPKPAEAKPEEPPEFVVGERTGTGYASHVVEADQVAQAPLAESDQPFISRDPAGEFGRSSRSSTAGAARPTRASSALQELLADAQPPRPPAIGVESTPPVPAPRPARVPQPKPQPAIESAVASAGEAQESPALSALERPTTAGDTEPLPPGPSAEAAAREASIAAPAVPLIEQPPQPTPAPVVEVKPPANTPPAVSASGASGDAAARPAGDPAPPLDADVDPFSQFGGADVVNGRLEVRPGRKIKPRRINLMLAGLVDAATMPGARIVLRVTIDAAGKVTSVTISKSSGSKTIDQATRVGLYDWWFEPKNVNGATVGDSFDFAIRFH
jgi:TonB family protein